MVPGGLFRAPKRHISKQKAHITPLTMKPNKVWISLRFRSLIICLRTSMLRGLGV